MNRNDFIRLLEFNGFVFYKHGTRHDIYVHQLTGKKIAVPRHSEIKNKFLKKILNEIPKKET